MGLERGKWKILYILAWCEAQFGESPFYLYMTDEAKKKNTIKQHNITENTKPYQPIRFKVVLFHQYEKGYS